MGMTGKGRGRGKGGWTWGSFVLWSRVASWCGAPLRWVSSGFSIPPSQRVTRLVSVRYFVDYSIDRLHLDRCNGSIASIFRLTLSLSLTTTVWWPPLMRRNSLCYDNVGSPLAHTVALSHREMQALSLIEPIDRLGSRTRFAWSLPLSHVSLTHYASHTHSIACEWVSRVR